jgi:adenine/guanine phosphoribosyltransferase-like PRPP-binding protein
MSLNISTKYLNSVFWPDVYAKVIDESLRIAQDLKARYQFDTIAFCGTSGAAIAFPLSYGMNLPMLCVRKQSIPSHQTPGDIVEGNVGTDKYLLVDDFISSGDTVKFIISSIKNSRPNAKCVAMLMYGAYSDTTVQYPGMEYSVPLFHSKPQDI